MDSTRLSPEQLRPGPAVLYPLKSALTRTRTAFWLLRNRGGLPDRGLRILFYHRVSDDRDELAVRPRSFREQMDYLAGQGYNVVDVSQAADLLDRGGAPERVIGLSFDDGYRDIAEHALPVLEERGFRATVFVATGVIDGLFSFPWYSRQPALLDWNEISELDRGSVFRFEAHSVSHPNLLRLSDHDAAEEIRVSKIELERRLRRPVEAFSYPAGLFGERERRFVAQSGFRIAVSCEPGVNSFDTDRFALRRRQIDARDSPLDFRAKVGGGHDSPPPFRRLYRDLRYGSGGRRPRELSARR